MNNLIIDEYLNGSTIEEDLDELPDDIESINVNSRQLTYLPDLSRFHNLKYLSCSHNYLRSLPPLNANLRILKCNNNRLTHLPPLNENLESLYCYTNKLTVLPGLNSNLDILDCCDNKLVSLPFLPPNLSIFQYMDNPIHDHVMYLNEGHHHHHNQNIIQIARLLYNFKHLFYSLKFKRQFRDWLWVKVREPKIQEHYSPENLKKLLSGIDEDDFEELDEALNNW
jgi:Leucine-rich repeat (LRR) protein